MEERVDDADIVGNGFTVTVVVLMELQLPLKPVIVYTVVATGLGAKVDVVAPVFHE
jgi:hypothetical protein